MPRFVIAQGRQWKSDRLGSQGDEKEQKNNGEFSTVLLLFLVCLAEA